MLCAATIRMPQKAFGEQSLSERSVYKMIKIVQGGGGEGVEHEKSVSLGRSKIRWCSKTVDLQLDDLTLHPESIWHFKCDHILKEILDVKYEKCRLVPKTLNFIKKEYRRWNLWGDNVWRLYLGNEKNTVKYNNCGIPHQESNLGLPATCRSSWPLDHAAAEQQRTKPLQVFKLKEEEEEEEQERRKEKKYSLTVSRSLQFWIV